MNKKIFIYTLTTLALAACSSDDDGTATPPTPERHLTVVVNEKPFESADGSKARERMDTRGNVITTSSLSGFKMNYGENRYTIKKVNQEWTTTPNTWPTVGYDTKITFYAYTAGTYYSAGNYLSFTAEENARSTTDLLVAKSLSTSYNDAKGQVNLTFSHACAAIYFTAEISNKLYEKSGNLTVNEIVLKNVVKQGDYNFSTKLWKPSSTITDYTLNNSDITATTTSQNLNNGDPLFLIPQTLSGSARFEITYNTDEKTSIPLNGVTVEAGKEYHMNIVLGTANIK